MLIILTTLATVTYGAVSKAIQYIADVSPYPQQATFVLNFPNTRAAILDDFRTHLKNIPRESQGKIVAVIDAIISVPGILLPWKEMVQICKEEGVISVVDAAHAIGQEVGINLKESDPDFWISVSVQY